MESKEVHHGGRTNIPLGESKEVHGRVTIWSEECNPRGVKGGVLGWYYHPVCEVYSRTSQKR